MYACRTELTPVTRISSDGQVTLSLFLWHKQFPFCTNEHNTHLNLVWKPRWGMILKREAGSGKWEVALRFVLTWLSKIGPTTVAGTLCFMRFRSYRSGAGKFLAGLINISFPITTLWWWWWCWWWW